MSGMNTVMGVGGDINPSDMDELLGDMEVSDEAIQAVDVIEEIEPELEAAVESASDEEIQELDAVEDDDLDAAGEAALEVLEAREEIYNEAAANSPAIDPSEPAPAPAPAKKAKSAKSSAPRVMRNLADLPPEAFYLNSAPPADPAANKDAVIRLRPGQVKIAEKFDNMLAALHAGRAPSVYIMTAFSVLNAKGEATSQELVNAITASTTKGGATKGLGTARSQTGQIMHLFDVLGVAKRVGQRLVLNTDSMLASKLRALL